MIVQIDWWCSASSTSSSCPLPIHELFYDCFSRCNTRAHCRRNMYALVGAGGSLQHPRIRWRAVGRGSRQHTYKEMEVEVAVEGDGHSLLVGGRGHGGQPAWRLPRLPPVESLKHDVLVLSIHWPPPTSTMMTTSCLCSRSGGHPWSSFVPTC